MADEAKTQDNNQTNPPAQASNKGGLGEFVAGLKKGLFSKPEDKTKTVPLNFTEQLKAQSTTNDILNALVTEAIGINTKITNNATDSLKGTKDVIKSIDKNGSILSQIQKNLKSVGSTPKDGSDAKTNDSINEVDTAEEALQKVKSQPVELVGISGDGLTALEKLFGKKVTTEDGKQGDGPDGSKKKPFYMRAAEGGDGDDKSLMGGIMKQLMKPFGAALSSGLLLAVTGLGASLALAIGSWFNDGPFKGLMKEVGLLGTKVFIPAVKSAFKVFTTLAPTIAKGIMKAFTGITGLFSKAGGGIATGFTKMFPMLAKFLGPILSKLPVIGTIINIGSAVSRFIKGDIIGGLIDLGSAVAVLVPFAGTAISIALGLINAGRDITGESKKTTGEQIADMGSVLKKAWNWLADKAKIVFNAYFGKIGKGIDQIKNGEWFRGIVTLASFAVPGFFWLENLYTWLAGPPAKGPEEGKKETLPSDILGKAWNWVKEKATKLFTWYFGKFGRGWDAIKKGDVLRGLYTWASLIPALAWVEPVYDWLMGTPEKINEDGSKEPAQAGILSKAWETVKGAITKKWNALLEGAISIIKAPGKALKSVWSKATSWFSGAAESVKGIIKDPTAAMKGMWNKGVDSMKRMVAAPGKVLKNVWGKATSWFNTAAQSAKNFIKDPTASLKEMWSKVKDAMKNIVMAPVNAIKKGWSKVTGWFSSDKKEEAVAPAKEVGVDKVAPNTENITQSAEEESLDESTSDTGIDKVAPKAAVAAAMAKPVSSTQIAKDTGIKKTASEEETFNSDETDTAQTSALTAPPTPESTIANQNITSMPKPVVPLQAPANPVTSALKDIKQTIGTTAKESKQDQQPVASNTSSVNSSNSAVSSSSSNITTIINTGSERDIPYIERNKYRQSLIYHRNLL